MIRRFDRYYGMICLTSVLAAVVGVALLFVVMDFFYNLDQFLSNDVSLDRVLRQYFYKTPPILYQVMPLIVLLGGMFAIARLLRANEVLPLQVGGVRVWRAFRTFWIIALAATALMYVAQEYWLPELERRSSMVAEADLRGGSGKDLFLDADNNAWRIHHYNVLATPPVLEGVNIICRDQFGTFTRRIYSESLEYRDGVWSGDYIVYSAGEAGTQRGQSVEKLVTGVPLPDGVTVTPGIIARKGSDTETRSLSTLWEEANATPYRNDLWIQLYSGLSYPLACLSLLMIGVTLALRFNARNLFVAGALTLVMAFASFSLSFILEDFARRGGISPIVATFGPALLLIALAAWCMRTQADLSR